MGSFADFHNVVAQDGMLLQPDEDRLNALPYNTIDFDVYKLNFEQQKWEPVKNGNHMLGAYKAALLVLDPRQEGPVSENESVRDNNGGMNSTDGIVYDENN
ncbi:hypothetical protein OIU84_003457 [Salix udensis]|uniref:Uncharacterized protein n=1 Tax=Salix udensis TaxID=889485 RepID=A0AAD6P3B0_9ROSI|nr:hypothetical protein OIU84_003457 [Salix udensis]